MSRVCLLLSLVAVAAAGKEEKGHSGDHWTYWGQAGPDQWPTLGFQKCSGQRQSPINVVTNRVVPARFEPLQFKNFNKEPLTLQFTNNHHSATAQMTWTEVPMISHGGLSGQYEVVNFHFHWGKDDFKGSEHTFDGESYPLEMHIVCKNMRYKNISEALQNRDGLAVLGVMFEQEQSQPIAEAGTALRPLESALTNITAGGATVDVASPPQLCHMMPWDHQEGFYRYDGSLTTPGCHESVTWTMFLQPVSVSAEQMRLFRDLRRNPEPIGFNYRPPQKRFGRLVYRSQPWTEERTVETRLYPGAAGSLLPPAPLLLLLLPLVMLAQLVRC